MAWFFKKFLFIFMERSHCFLPLRKWSLSRTSVIFFRGVFTPQYVLFFAVSLFNAYHADFNIFYFLLIEIFKQRNWNKSTKCRSPIHDVVKSCKTRIKMLFKSSNKCWQTFSLLFFFSTMNMDGFHLKKKIGKETKMAKTSELKM